MFKMRIGQIETLRGIHLDMFEARMVRILRQWFPADCEAMEETELREFIRSSVERAEGLGASAEVAEAALSKYVTMEFIVGTEAMRELIAAEKERLPWCRPRENVVMLIDAVCRAGVVRLEGPMPEPEPQEEYYPLPRQGGA